MVKKTVNTAINVVLYHEKDVQFAGRSGCGKGYSPSIIVKQLKGDLTSHRKQGWLLEVCVLCIPAQPESLSVVVHSLAFYRQNQA